MHRSNAFSLFSNDSSMCAAAVCKHLRRMLRRMLRRRYAALREPETKNSMLYNPPAQCSRHRNQEKRIVSQEGKLCARAMSRLFIGLAGLCSFSVVDSSARKKKKKECQSDTLSSCAGCIRTWWSGGRTRSGCDGALVLLLVQNARRAWMVVTYSLGLETPAAEAAASMSEAASEAAEKSLFLLRTV
jgi:hypothetical protein